MPPKKRLAGVVAKALAAERRGSIMPCVDASALQDIKTPEGVATLEEETRREMMAYSLGVRAEAQRHLHHAGRADLEKHEAAGRWRIMDAQMTIRRVLQRMLALAIEETNGRDQITSQGNLLHVTMLELMVLVAVEARERQKIKNGAVKGFRFIQHSLILHTDQSTERLHLQVEETIAFGELSDRARVRQIECLARLELLTHHRTKMDAILRDIAAVERRNQADRREALRSAESAARGTVVEDWQKRFSVLKAFHAVRIDENTKRNNLMNSEQKSVLVILNISALRSDEHKRRLKLYDEEQIARVKVGMARDMQGIHTHSNVIRNWVKNCEKFLRQQLQSRQQLEQKYVIGWGAIKEQWTAQYYARRRSDLVNFHKADRKTLVTEQQGRRSFLYDCFGILMDWSTTRDALIKEYKTRLESVRPLEACQRIGITEKFAIMNCEEPAAWVKIGEEKYLSLLISRTNEVIRVETRKRSSFMKFWQNDWKILFQWVEYTLRKQIDDRAALARERVRGLAMLRVEFDEEVVRWSLQKKYERELAITRAKVAELLQLFTQNERGAREIEKQQQAEFILVRFEEVVNRAPLGKQAIIKDYDWFIFSSTGRRELIAVEIAARKVIQQEEKYRRSLTANLWFGLEADQTVSRSSIVRDEEEEFTSFLTTELMERKRELEEDQRRAAREAAAKARRLAQLKERKEKEQRERWYAEAVLRDAERHAEEISRQREFEMAHPQAAKRQREEAAIRNLEERMTNGWNNCTVMPPDTSGLGPLKVVPSLKQYKEKLKRTKDVLLLNEVKKSQSKYEVTELTRQFSAAHISPSVSSTSRAGNSPVDSNNRLPSIIPPVSQATVAVSPASETVADSIVGPSVDLSGIKARVEAANALALQLCDQGRLELARDALRGAVVETELPHWSAASDVHKELGRLYCTTLNNLSYVEKKRGDNAHALRTLERSAAIENTLTGSPDVSTLVNICAVNTCLNKYNDALRHAWRAVRLIEAKIADPTSEEVKRDVIVTAWHALGTAQQYCSDPSERSHAKSTFEGALHFAEEHLGAAHPLTHAVRAAYEAAPVPTQSKGGLPAVPTRRAYTLR